MVVAYWPLFVFVAAVLGFLGLISWRRCRQLRGEALLAGARQSFHHRREWLEAKFWSLASRSGRPRGIRWVDCEFDDEVAFARDRNTGHLRALVGVTIQFEAVEGSGLEDENALAERKAATVVFRLDGLHWEVDGRAYFNLNPAQTIAHYQHELETVD
jgi:hypothetical protein